jgi:para-aminobenzoate synthetase
LRTLLLDNHDSYTFNLFQLIAEVNGTEPTVIVNDDPALASLRLEEFDNIVISPGPGRPQQPRDVGLVDDLLRRTTLPVLGVCLGHQLIAHVAGATVEAAPEPRHGHLAKVVHTGDDLFEGIPGEFIAVRYHSLCVREPLPPELEVTARADDGVVMALRHRNLPRWGVQFHPESIASRYGLELIRNFAELTRRRRATSTPAGPSAAGAPEPAGTPAADLRLISAVVPTAADTEAIFGALYEDSANCFWLDSSRVEPGLSRFSFLGDASGPLSEVLTYRLGTGAVKIRDAGGVRVTTGSIFDVLEERLRQRRLPETHLPFDFTGGYVGYFGYELKAECGANPRHTSPTPDAAWIFADRLVAVDHEEGVTYILAVHGPAGRDGAVDWLDRTAAVLVDLAPASAPESVALGDGGTDAAAHLVRDQAGYEADIEECRRQLTRGESYEICLTNKLHVPFAEEDAAFYRRLRRVNPAPYSAFLRVDDIAVFCSSPERFLKIERDRQVQSKPIKGTAPRHPDPARDAQIAADLAADAKTQAENLMIVDLLRNDLGQVCEIGSVHVDPFMAVESYQTVHQLVSTVRGVLKPDVTPMATVRHCFPGGSMTGAPKQRTMEIIDRLETEARGVYSGTLGFFGLTGGADLNIVIRTAVRQDDRLSIGAGGAIVLGSDTREEYEEMLLKAAAPLRAYRAPAVSSDSRGVSS